MVKVFVCESMARTVCPSVFFFFAFKVHSLVGKIRKKWMLPPMYSGMTSIMFLVLRDDILF